jgi:hypothetical protein
MFTFKTRVTNSIQDAKIFNEVQNKAKGALNFASKAMCEPTSHITQDMVNDALKDMANPKVNPHTGLLQT